MWMRVDGVWLLGLDRNQDLETNMSRRETRMPRHREADRVIPNPLHDGLRTWVWQQRRFLCDNGVSVSSRRVSGGSGVVFSRRKDLVFQRLSSGRDLDGIHD
ncbi:hypothetical protein V8G54_026816 [Vigna mungo]|uniref:Uncharacterized protein n=1 Tax=Vigna mungo TaxID=3915 RepID=A0AAQ3N133_VIGMU